YPDSRHDQPRRLLRPLRLFPDGQRLLHRHRHSALHRIRGVRLHHRRLRGRYVHGRLDS
ncbi:Uracil-DNA glycosylase, partial [Dysosmobacter welbionis]